MDIGRFICRNCIHLWKSKERVLSCCFSPECIKASKDDKISRRIAIYRWNRSKQPDILIRQFFSIMWSFVVSIDGYADYYWYWILWTPFPCPPKGQTESRHLINKLNIDAYRKPEDPRIIQNCYHTQVSNKGLWNDTWSRRNTLCFLHQSGGVQVRRDYLPDSLSKLTCYFTSGLLDLNFFVRWKKKVPFSVCMDRLSTQSKGFTSISRLSLRKVGLIFQIYQFTVSMHGHTDV